MEEVKPVKGKYYRCKNSGEWFKVIHLGGYADVGVEYSFTHIHDGSSSGRLCWYVPAERHVFDPLRKSIPRIELDYTVGLDSPPLRESLPTNMPEEEYKQLAIMQASGGTAGLTENITRPAHYGKGRKYEPIDVIADWGLNFNLGNVVKYIARAGRKGDRTEDLSKALSYLKHELGVRE